MNSNAPITDGGYKSGKKRDALSLIAIALMLIAALYVLSCRAIGQLPYVFGRAYVRITSGSMEPSIPTDSYILVRKVSRDEANRLEVGQIIIFESTDEQIFGRLNTHRIDSINPDGSYSTKGDFNLTADDDPVYPHQVLGVYVKNADTVTAIYGTLSDNWLVTLIAILGLATAYFAICAARELMDKHHNTSTVSIAAAELERIRADEQLSREIDARIAEELKRIRDGSGAVPEQEKEGKE